ncbi:MAG: hypothetical protein IPI49_08870 [Myxococcales bacterium]|nr:hypothetical protein [Myxococcales bacterium]
MTERRRNRSENSSEALHHQLEACCHDGAIEAMVIADDEGLTLASCGDPYACDEIAARTAVAGRRVAEFAGTLLGHAQAWDVQMKRIAVGGAELLVCAVGGSELMRQRQIERSAAGASRILGH